jgi:hypothetical protein
VTAESEALAELEWHWGSAYLIANPEPGAWIAQRRDDFGTLRAASVDELWQAIRADYAARPVRRDDG